MSMNSNVKAVFLSYPPVIRKRLYMIRDLIFDVASSHEAIGPITETLKWNEPSYLTEVSKSGSTIRLGWKEATPNEYAIYFHCQTGIIDTCRQLFPELRFAGNRALVFDATEDLPVGSVSKCIEVALTYHLSNRRRKTSC